MADNSWIKRKDEEWTKKTQEWIDRRLKEEEIHGFIDIDIAIERAERFVKECEATPCLIMCDGETPQEYLDHLRMMKALGIDKVID